MANRARKSIARQDADSRVPRYLQLASVLRRRIRDGHWAVGGKIATLEELEREFNVARVTVRQAIDLLQGEGLVKSFQGRGTFVTKAVENDRWMQLATDWESLIAPIRDHVPHVLPSEPRPVPRFEDGDGMPAPGYVFLRSVQKRAGKPYAYARVHIAKHLHAKVPKQFSSRVALAVLSEMKDVAISRAHQTVVVGAPGTKVSFDLTVDSTRAANVSLELGGVPEGWTASLLGGGFVVDGVAVTPGTAAEVRLDVDVPADAGAATSTLQVTARGGGAQDVLPIAIRVNAEAAGDITLTTSTPTLTGASDATFTFDLQLQNDTAQDVTVSVAASGPEGWDVEATLTGETQAASTIVEAGATQSIGVTANAPADVPADVYPITVEARAGERTIPAELGIEVTGSYSMTLATPNDVLSASGSAGSPTTQAFDITNTGTAPLTEVTLNASTPTNWEVTMEPPTVALIEPGATQTITATIMPSGEAVAGDYVIEFEATAAEEGAEDGNQVRFTVETSPLWALVGLGLIALIVAGLFYVFRTYGRR